MLMKVLFNILVILLLSTSVAYGEAKLVNKPVICDTYENAHKIITEDAGEVPIVLGNTAQEDNTFKQMTVTYNKDTGTWTLMLISPEAERVCVVEIGNGIQVNTKYLLELQETGL